MLEFVGVRRVPAQDELGEDTAAPLRYQWEIGSPRFENLRRCLAAAGATFADVIKFTYFVTDVAHLPAVRAAREAVIDTERPPASSAVQVVALFRPELVVEIEALALVAS